MVAPSRRQLSDGEHVIASTRTHGKALILPGAAFIATCAITGFLIALLPSGGTHDPPLLWLVLALALVVVGYACLRPFLRWLTSSYTVTNRRLITRTGVLTRRGRDIPLHKINDVTSERGVLDRMLGCGTLVVSDASEEGKSVLHDVPHVEQLRLLITDLIFGRPEGSDVEGVGRRGGNGLSRWDAEGASRSGGLGPAHRDADDLAGRDAEGAAHQDVEGAAGRSVEPRRW
ncbi:MAG TPA: PH domain-containing protein [Nocardioidaceae bacterium]|nr:PH domain-containing protein [Nocardioidaceae bacterium]